MKKNKAKFFCENCGTEVPENAKFCKTCGKFFSAVRCPNCGATGNAADFSKGCPLCGYAVNGNGSMGTYSSAESKKNKNIRFGDLRFNTNGADTHWRPDFFAYFKREHSLPPWIYIITSGMLLVLIVVFYSCIKNPAY